MLIGSARVLRFCSPDGEKTVWNRPDGSGQVCALLILNFHLLQSMKKEVRDGPCQRFPFGCCVFFVHSLNDFLDSLTLCQHTKESGCQCWRRVGDVLLQVAGLVWIIWSITGSLGGSTLSAKDVQLTDYSVWRLPLHGLTNRIKRKASVTSRNMSSFGRTGSF